MLEDLKYLDLEQLSMDSIRKMKKGSFMNMIKKETSWGRAVPSSGQAGDS